jgi:uncharacterized protein (TIGR00725 family)
MAGQGPWIGLVGPGHDAAATDLAHAEEGGVAVAAAGAVLVCGGLGGVMAAACRGARSRGGLTVGLLPGADRADANEWVVVSVPTGLGEARNALIVRCADAIVAVGGGWGTLSEIALALRAGLPVVGVDTWQPARGGAVVDGVVAAADGRSAVEEAMRRLEHGVKPRVP